MCNENCVVPLPGAKFLILTVSSKVVQPSSIVSSASSPTPPSGATHPVLQSGTRLLEPDSPVELATLGDSLHSEIELICSVHLFKENANTRFFI